MVGQDRHSQDSCWLSELMPGRRQASATRIESMSHETEGVSMVLFSDAMIVAR